MGTLELSCTQFSDTIHGHCWWQWPCCLLLISYKTSPLVDIWSKKNQTPPAKKNTHVSIELSRYLTSFQKKKKKTISVADEHTIISRTNIPALPRHHPLVGCCFCTAMLLGPSIQIYSPLLLVTWMFLKMGHTTNMTIKSWENWQSTNWEILFSDKCARPFRNPSFQFSITFTNLLVLRGPLSHPTFDGKIPVFDG